MVNEKRITDYVMVNNPETVRVYLRKGYQPWGSPATSLGNDGVKFHQAMVLSEEVVPDEKGKEKEVPNENNRISSRDVER